MSSASGLAIGHSQPSTTSGVLCCFRFLTGCLGGMTLGA